MEKAVGTVTACRILGVSRATPHRRRNPKPPTAGERRPFHHPAQLSDDRSGEKEPVFYAGSTLAPDLSLPRIRERWALPMEAVASADDSGRDQPVLPDVTGPAFARRRATAATWQALLVIDHGDDGAAAAQIAAAGEVLDALAKTSAAHTRAELREAAFVFERASRPCPAGPPRTEQTARPSQAPRTQQISPGPPEWPADQRPSGRADAARPLGV